MSTAAQRIADDLNQAQAGVEVYYNADGEAIFSARHDGPFSTRLSEAVIFHGSRNDAAPWTAERVQRAIDSRYASLPEMLAEPRWLVRDWQRRQEYLSARLPILQAAAAVRAAERALADAQEARDGAIRTVLADGSLSTVEVARLTGMARSRVYQIAQKS